MTNPTDLRYTASHEWVRKEADGSFSVGITDHAQEALGDIVFVELPEVGKVMGRSEECAVIESVKAAGDLYAPVACEVVAVNEALATNPELINSDPFGSWVFKMIPADPASIDKLMDAEAYGKSID